jgi:hypothetical protein
MIKKYTKTDDNSHTYEVEYNTDFENELAIQKKRSPYLLWFFVKYNESTCNDIDENVISMITDSLNAPYAGKKIDDGWCEYYFYAQTAKGFETKLRDALSTFGIKNFESGSSKDENHEHYYKVLYPSELQALKFQSEAIIEDLLNAGDNIKEPRDVEHYVLFITRSQRDRFIEDCEYKDTEPFEHEGEFLYGISIHVKHAPYDVDKYIDKFYKKALEFRGEYKLYSTSLI